MVGPASSFVDFLTAAREYPGMEITIVEEDIIPSANATLVTGVTGAATITAGMAVYSSGNVFSPASNGATAVEALATGIAMGTSYAGQPVVVCTQDPELTLGTTALPATLVGEVISLGYTGGTIVTHGDIAGSGLYAKVIGLVTASGTIQMNLTGMIPAIEAYTTP